MLVIPSCALASLVYRSVHPVYFPRWLMPSSLCQGRQKGKKSTLKRLTGTGRNTETPCSHPQLECINMYPFPDWCLLFVRDGKNARTQQLVACADRSRGFSFVIEKKKNIFNLEPTLLTAPCPRSHAQNSKLWARRSKGLLSLTSSLTVFLFPVAVARQTLTTNTQTNQASHTTLRSCCFFLLFFFASTLNYMDQHTRVCFRQAETFPFCRDFEHLTLKLVLLNGIN